MYNGLQLSWRQPHHGPVVRNYSTSDDSYYFEPWSIGNFGNMQWTEYETPLIETSIEREDDSLINALYHNANAVLYVEYKKLGYNLPPHKLSLDDIRATYDSLPNFGHEPTLEEFYDAILGRGIMLEEDFFQQIPHPRRARFGYQLYDSTQPEFEDNIDYELLVRPVIAAFYPNVNYGPITCVYDSSLSQEFNWNGNTRSFRVVNVTGRAKWNEMELYEYQNSWGPGFGWNGFGYLNKGALTTMCALRWIPDQF